MLLPKKAVRMRAKDLENVGLVIPAAKCQENTPLLKPDQPPLECDETRARVVWAEGNTVHSVLADDTAPEGVVGVEDDALDTRPFDQNPVRQQAPRQGLSTDHGERKPA